MAHEKKCPGCGKTFWGNINKKTCSESCRKHCNRKGIDLNVISNFQGINADTPPPLLPQMSRKSGTSGGNDFLSYTGKRLVDLGFDYIKNKNKPEKEIIPTSPLIVENVELDGIRAIIESMKPKINLREKFSQFIGDLSAPFKFLLWGKPGSGKSTLALMLTNELSMNGKVLYVSGEERPSGKTFQNKVKMTIEEANKKNISVISRLPQNNAEWRQILYDQNGYLIYQYIFYDSIQILDMDPFYIKGMNAKLGNTDFTDRLNHIYISYADKDGENYSGAAAWSHEVDSIIKCDLGIASIKKNRFATDTNGLNGTEFIIYKNMDNSL